MRSLLTGAQAISRPPQLLLLMLVTVTTLGWAACPAVRSVRQIGGCQVFDSDNEFNRRVDDWPVCPGSDAAMQHLDRTVNGSGIAPGMGALVWEGSRGGHPINVINSSLFPGRAEVQADCVYVCGSQRYPIPASYRLEGWPNPFGAWDRHLILLDNSSCTLHELFLFRDFGSLKVMGGASTWNLSTTMTRTHRLAGAEAAGLPMTTGLVSYDEAAVDECITHASRFASAMIRNKFVYPASHTDGRSNDSVALPMGGRLRLKAGVSLQSLGRIARVVATSWKEYGLIAGDTTVSGWGAGGEPDPRWNDTDLATLRTLTANDFEWVAPPERMTEICSISPATNATSSAPKPLLSPRHALALMAVFFTLCLL